MKMRNGFVSNSSSSSFVLNRDMNGEDFKDEIIRTWEENFKGTKYENTLNIKEEVNKVFTYIEPRFFKNKKELKKKIEDLYGNECWGAKHKTYYPTSRMSYYGKNIFTKIKVFFYNLPHNIKWLFSTTYMREAMKAHVFGTSKENAIPYEVLEKLKETYGKDLTIHHLG